MNSNIEIKRLFWISLVIVSHLAFTFLNYRYFKLDFVLIGVFRELLTIPLFILQFVVLFFALKNFFSAKTSLKTYSLFTAIILGTSSVLTFGSFFV